MPRSALDRTPLHLFACTVVALLCLFPALLAADAATSSGAATPRIVSVNPSLTAILIALGASGTLVGVDDYSAAQHPEVEALPRVGGLFSPSLEAVVALQPDVVVLVPSAEQRDFRARLESLSIRVSVFENIRFDQVLENIERLGRMVGREAQAEARISSIAHARDTARRVTRGRPQPKVLIVLQRDPVFVVGSGSFIAEMIETVGARNLAAEFDDPYPRVAEEWVVARAPEVLIDLSPEAADPQTYWSRWPSIPAVAQGRVLRLEAEMISLPGPYLDRALATLAASIHGEAVAAEIRRGSER
jgi:iron complex transport system substrate-binding protein